MKSSLQKMLALLMAAVMLMGTVPVEAIADMIRTDTSTAVKISEAVPLQKQQDGEGAEQTAQGAEAEPGAEEAAQGAETEPGAEEAAQGAETEPGAEEAAQGAEAEPGAEETDALEEPVLVQQTISAAMGGGTGFRARAAVPSSITLSGMMPGGAAATAVPADAGGMSGLVLGAWDITIAYALSEADAPRAFQPASESPLTVSISSPALLGHKRVNIYHEGALLYGGVSVLGDSVSFSASSFSVYAIGAAADDARLEVIFHHAYSQDVTEFYVNKADIPQLDTVIHDPDVGALPDGHVFRGWTAEGNYDAQDQGMDVDAVRLLVADRLNAGVQDMDRLELYPMLFKGFSIHYLDEDGSALGSEVQLLPVTQQSVAYTVNMGYTPHTGEQNFMGWHVAAGGGSIAGHDGHGTLYANGEEITLSGDVTFSADAPRGHWLVFDENGKGATYHAPEFYKTGEVTREAAFLMERQGYTFAGWYTDEACTAGNEFAFGAPLQDNTTIYARWEVTPTAEYTVLIWRQHTVGDAYDFAEAITLAGSVNADVNTVEERGSGNDAYARINGVDKRYTGFHLNRFDRDVTINPEGTAVVNVYYDRNKITYNFYQRISRQWRLQLSMTGRYGSTLAENNYAWPEDLWWYDKYTVQWGNTVVGAGTRYTFLDAFLPPPGQTTMGFYGFQPDNGSKTIRFYRQNPDDTGYTEANTVGSAAQTFSITDKYAGFRAASYSIDGGWSWSTLGNPDGTGVYAKVNLPGNTELHIRFDRLKYNLLYRDGVFVRSNGTEVEGYTPTQIATVSGIAYGSDMDAYNTGKEKHYIPSPRAGFAFGGWFADENCTQPYTFTRMDEGITVYAKWMQTEYRVFLHSNAGGDPTLYWGSDNQAMNFRVPYGGRVSAPTGQRNDYEFVGWYLDAACTRVFNGDVFVLNDSTVTAFYDKTATMTDGNVNNDVDRFWITRKLDLYAKWRAVLTGASGIGILYDANGGSAPPTDHGHYRDGAAAVAGAASEPPAGKHFSHWVVQQWDAAQGKYVDTPTHVFPGAAFYVLKANAEVVEEPDSTLQNPRFRYTVRLRAAYSDIPAVSETKVVFNPNGGAFADGSVANIEQTVPVNTTGCVSRGADAERLCLPWLGCLPNGHGPSAGERQGLCGECAARRCMGRGQPGKRAVRSVGKAGADKIRCPRRV